MNLLKGMLLLLVSSSIYAQSNDTLAVNYLETVTVTATRLESNARTIPQSIHLKNISRLNSTQNLSLKDQLLTTPGVYTQNAYNYAQDLRISIRGFGAQAAFGINGIKLIVDGIPETTPDGQGQLDNLNLGLMEEIEVVNGASSTLYGNASGGVINIKTKIHKEDYLEADISAGSYGYHSVSTTMASAKDKTFYQLYFREFRWGGFRDHSQLEQINSNFKIDHQFSNKLKVNFLLDYMNSPEALDPGGLTLEEASENFHAARKANLDYQAREAIEQFKAGLGLDYSSSKALKVNSYVFINRRVFDGWLPFENGGSIDLDRNYFGQGIGLELLHGAHQVKIGYDALLQYDHRERYQNIKGARGDLTFKQDENFENVGVYLLDHIELAAFYLTAGIRYDKNWIEAKDQNPDDGDGSDKLVLGNFSGSLGLSYSITNGLVVFSNFSTGFQTPTLNQLSNRPDGKEGFNDLDPATTKNLELGIKRAKNKFQGELTSFYITTNNEMVPFELETFPGRTFYRNAGSTKRSGVELSLAYLTETLKIYGSYTFADLAYKSYMLDEDNLSGNILPGVPGQYAGLTVNKKTDNLTTEIAFNFSGRLYADDLNETRIDEYLIANVQLKYEITMENIDLIPYLGLNNLFDTHYFDNIRINAFGERYYEPAPGIHFFGGLRVIW